MGGEGRALDALAMALMIVGRPRRVRRARAGGPPPPGRGGRPADRGLLPLEPGLGPPLPRPPRRGRAGHAPGARGRAGDRRPGAGGVRPRRRGRAARAVRRVGPRLRRGRDGAGDRARARATASGRPRRSRSLGRVRRNCGDVAGARARHEEMLGIARELRTTLWIADALSELGQDLVAAGEIADGARHLAEAIEAAHEAVQFTVRPGVALTELALRTGRPADALEPPRAPASPSRPSSPSTCSMRGEPRARRSSPSGVATRARHGSGR